MSYRAGHEAMIRRIVGMTNPPNIHVPDDAELVGLPRYVIQQAGTTTRQIGFGTVTDARHVLNVRVETEADGFATMNMELVDKLIALFRPGDQFECIQIEQPPVIAPPIVGGGVYSVPVTITGRMFY